MWITRFVLKRPVTVILCVLCLAFFGIQSILGMKLELTPEMDMSMMIIQTRYTGASPDDVSELVTKPLEEAVSTLSGIDTVSSTSSEGSSMVMLEYEYGTDMDEAYDNLKKVVDAAVSRELPEDVDTPTIMEMNINATSDITMVIENSTVENLYNYVDEEIIPEFERIPEAADISMSGGEEEYIRIELNSEKMKQYGVTMSSLAADIGAADISYPAGITEVGNQDISVSAKMEYDTQEALKDIPLTVNGQGIVHLQDVAEIYRTQEDAGSIARYNGSDTISVNITRQQSSTAKALSEAVKKEAEALMDREDGLSISIISDSSQSVEDSLWSVVESMALAIVIAMIIIWLFFGDIKASLIVGSSIPISILAALLGMSWMDFTMNVITLCALTLGVGMMVDNSIVVLESCFRSAKDTKNGFIDYMKTALNGTSIVQSSVTASTVTTCVVFIPLALLEGMTGQMLGPLGYTIVFCMAASLVSAISIVPLCYMLYRPKEKEQAPCSSFIEKLQHLYRERLKNILPKRKTVMGISVFLLIISIFLAAQLDMELMASDDNGQISISVETRPGLKIQKLDESLKQIEAVITQHEDLDSYMTTTGSRSFMSDGTAGITAYLKENRKMSTDEVVKIWKKELQSVPNCNITVEKNSSMSMMTTTTNSFESILMGADYDRVKQSADKITEELMKRPEVTKVHSDLENAAPVVTVKVDGVKAKAHGLTAASIGNTLNQMISGMEVTQLEEDGNNISVKAEYPEKFETLEQVSGIVLSTGNGGSVLLTDVADIGFEDSPASINRESRQYKVTISADYTEIAGKETSSILKKEVIEPNLVSGVVQGVNSRDQMMNEEFSDLYMAIFTAIFLVFIVMAAQFESPKFSLMVMITIPFSLIGSFGLLWLTGTAISMVSLVGFMMLIGTVVNAGILYVDTVNQYRASMPLEQALIEAGATRIRPILMTTLTTVIAMIPMAIGFGSSGEMTKGLAIVNIGGLTASTILSLIMLPVFYSIMSGKKEGNEAYD